MGRNGLFIGEVAARSGVSRKALRLYEAAGILPTPSRSAARYRLYGHETLALVGFVAQARRLGFTLKDIRQIVSIKRSGRAPRRHVRELVLRKVADLDRTLADLAEVRGALQGLLRWRGAGRGRGAVICACIEAAKGPEKASPERRTGSHGELQGAAVPGWLRRVPRGRDRRGRGADRRGGEPRGPEKGRVERPGGADPVRAADEGVSGRRAGQRVVPAGRIRAGAGPGAG